MNKDEIKQITKYIFLESRPQKADLAFVFGTRHVEATRKTIEIYNTKLVPLVLVSGGINAITKENEAEKMMAGLIDLGVNKKDIIIEDRSTNTLENVFFSRNVLENTVDFEKIKSILLIVKNYHSRRALMTIKKHFPKTINIFPVTYVVDGLTKYNWYDYKEGKEKVMSEWQKIHEYLNKGDLEEF